MINVAALVGGRNDPSARLRVRQHIPPLAEAGIRVHEYVPAIDKYSDPPLLQRRPMTYLWTGLKLVTRLPGVVGSWGYDLVWLQRELINARYSLEGALKRPCVLDVDDAIWIQYRAEGGAQAIRRIVAGTDLVLAGNAFLAEWLSSYARSVRVVPTAVDCDRFTPAPARAGAGFTLGWIGTRWNLPYLESLEEPLRGLFRDHADAELLVIADRPATFRDLPADRVRFVRWSDAGEVGALQEADVGLMPMPDDEWARGKCSLKMLQYMACGLPVVVSPFGMNAEVLAMGDVGIGATGPGEWRDAFETLYADPALRARLGAAGRRVVEDRFRRDIVTALIRDAFRSLV